MTLSASDSTGMYSGFHLSTVPRKAGGLWSESTISHSSIEKGVVEDERSLDSFQHTFLLLFPSPPLIGVHCWVQLQQGKADDCQCLLLKITQQQKGTAFQHL